MLEQALNILNKYSATYTYDIYCPSLEKNISFTDMAIGSYKTMTKSALQSDSTFYEFLCALVLQLSNNQFKLADINDIDLTLILFAIKYNNDQETQYYKIKCPYCKASNKIIVDNDCLHSKEIKYTDCVKDVKLKEDSIQLTYKLPSVLTLLDYFKYLDNKKVKYTDNKEKFIYDISNEFEKNLLNISAIKINDVIYNLNESPINERLDFIMKLPKSILDMDYLAEFVDKHCSLLTIATNCGSCSQQLNHFLKPDSFFL